MRKTFINTKFKVGDVVQYASDCFGIIKKIVITVDDNDTLVDYLIGEHLIAEKDITRQYIPLQTIEELTD